MIAQDSAYRQIGVGGSLSPQPQQVSVVQKTQYWITLPGDTASHKLTEQQAKELLRKLEELLRKLEEVV